jgi:hypothetical protein
MKVLKKNGAKVMHMNAAIRMAARWPKRRPASGGSELPTAALQGCCRSVAAAACCSETSKG